MDISDLTKEYNLEVIRLRKIQSRTRKRRVHKKLEKRIDRLKEKIVMEIKIQYVPCAYGHILEGNYSIFETIV